jgi:hypothetical protein
MLGRSTETRRFRLVSAVLGTFILSAQCATAQVNGLDQEEREAASSQPKCSVVRFTGIAVGGNGQSFEAVRTSPDPEDLVARNPLRCGPSGFTQTYACQGAGYVRNQRGYVIAWSKTGYQIATPIQLESGKKDSLVFVQRKDAQCLDSTPPSLDFVENLHNFLRNHNAYR